MISGDDIYVVMSNEGVGALYSVVVDSEYDHATRTWLLGAFAEATRKNLKGLGLADYAAEAWDCDDFAWTVASLGRMNHRISGRGKTTKRALALGWMGYQVDGGGGHAIVFAIVKKATGHDVMFIEPQNGKEITLSRSEKDNCLFWIV